MNLTNEQRTAINELRDAGYCLVIFTPDELKGADPEYIEERLIERGNDLIDIYAEDEAN